MLKIAFDKSYRHPLDEKHRFPMIKYELIPEQLIRENTCNDSNFFIPGCIEDKDVLTTHEETYYRKLCYLKLTPKEARPIGFPMSKSLIKREKLISQGTIECVSNSLKNGVSMNIAGGTHHAFRDRAEAFCMLNDQAIGANFLLENNLASKILIIDLDVHQGNGTASIFNLDNRVFTISFHGKKNYPFHKEKSDIDVEFDDDTGDIEYLKKMDAVIPNIIDEFQPNFIFYLSGVDILKNDRLGRLGVSIDGCKKRDEIILNLCKRNNIPLQISMGGGYSHDLKNIIEAHSNTFRLAQEIYF